MLTQEQSQWLEENSRPFKYSIVFKRGDEIMHETQTNDAPVEWRCKMEMGWFNATSYRCYYRPRYDAELRLWKYLAKKMGIETEYKPFKGTEIGKSQPILNF